MTKTPVEIYRERSISQGEVKELLRGFRIGQRNFAIAILKAELEQVEGQIEQRTAMDEECRWCSRQFCDMDGNVCVQRVTHNTALTDHANYIKSQIKEIERI